MEHLKEIVKIRNVILREVADRRKSRFNEREAEITLTNGLEYIRLKTSIRKEKKEEKSLNEKCAKIGKKKTRLWSRNTCGIRANRGKNGSIWSVLI